MEENKFVAQKRPHPALRNATNFTVIDHKIRVQLGISNDEYVMIEFISRFNSLNKTGGISFRIYHDNIAIPYDQVVPILQKLKSKKLLWKNPATNRIETTQKWNSYFNTDEQFNELWALCNRGNKQNAKKMFDRCKGLVPFDTLKESLIKYLKTKTDPTYIMHLSTWLNPATKHWEDQLEYKGQLQKPKSQQGGMVY